MFDIGLQEMLVIGVIALLVFGPSRLPELGRMVGRAMREFRRASDEFRSTVETNLQFNEVDAPLPSYSAAPEPTIPAVPGAAPSASDTGTLVTTDVSETEEAPVVPGEPYVARRQARLFHRRECIWTARIAETDRVYLKSVAEAREHGFVNCPACEPWEPA